MNLTREEIMKLHTKLKFRFSILLILTLFALPWKLSLAQQFKFVVLGDSQFENPKTFEEIVKETELLHPAFVIHVGDMIHG